MAMVATLAALVLGLLTASAKSSLDEKESEQRSAAAQVLLLDRTMAEYGPETKDARDLLKQTVAARISQIWPDEKANVTPDVIGRGTGIEAVQRKLLDLSPQTDAQRWLQSTALQISGSIAAERWAVLQQIGSSIQWPFMAVLIFWLAIIFASFGLFAPRNASMTAALLVAALSVAGSVYLSNPRNGPAL
jgi:type II secretory pathway pseudopilin PulG